MNIYIYRIRQLVLSVLADEEVNIYLFGSWARGTARHGSDVDVAVEFLGVPNERKIADATGRIDHSLSCGYCRYEQSRRIIARGNQKGWYSLELIDRKLFQTRID